MVVDTSQMAYDTIKHLLSEKQLQVLTVFIRNPDRSYTNMELAEELGWSINRVTPRTNELRRLGLLITVGKRACKVTGRTAYAMEEKIR